MSNALILGALHASRIRLPFFDAHIPAGFPSPALDHMEHKLSLDELLDINAPHTYVVLVSGDSMTGAGIFDGDHLIVSRALEAKPGDVVVACLNGDVFVKRLGKSHRTYVLQSEHPDYAPRYVLDDDELMIWGVVSHSLRNHRTHA
ncbi:MAG: translesion error-prone DNA polymerase V autoproteolytic subunit [Gammaproteobacteria bacterium]|nr:translesion error-prone DNA polymerase V autoproteolytic subunit [Gammaproteobacteria bacterium]MBU2154706.1 translesion error-prone DNA polymerase V autoproteolytic subunit [Gammaproteobacteria bacterium]MBU2257216.1 translesion error-prone DNA polymerase V autoproteolytic subunit [Gammaproteobacteria bacterium]MBU2293284.1 translesion error-prone DNA polymerase V autoproteolytic subunit [Gammaproteobacteria bacterium]